MKKRILAALILVTFLMSGSVFAVGEDRLFGGFKMYTGTVWLVNDEDNTVILQNVKTKNIYGQEMIVPDLIYKAISIIPQNIFYKDGQPLSFDAINDYLLDSKVTFVAAVNAYEYKVLYMEVQ